MGTVNTVNTVNMDKQWLAHVTLFISRDCEGPGKHYRIMVVKIKALGSSHEDLHGLKILLGGVQNGMVQGEITYLLITYCGFVAINPKRH